MDSIKISRIVVLLVLLGQANSLFAGSISGVIGVVGSSSTEAMVNFKGKISDTGAIEETSQLIVTDGDKKTTVKISALKIDGQYAWFSGKCISGNSDKLGHWLFVAVDDGGTPGNISDHVWWEWLGNDAKAESEAASKVKNLKKPVENKPVKSGDIVVNNR